MCWYMLRNGTLLGFGSKQTARTKKRERHIKRHRESSPRNHWAVPDVDGAGHWWWAVKISPSSRRVGAVELKSRGETWHVSRHVSRHVICTSALRLHLLRAAISARFELSAIAWIHRVVWLVSKVCQRTQSWIYLYLTTVSRQGIASCHHGDDLQQKYIASGCSQATVTVAQKLWKRTWQTSTTVWTVVERLKILQRSQL